MKRNLYNNNKLNDIIALPQFQKCVPKRKNEKNQIQKEEERIISCLKSLKGQNRISDSLYFKLKPIGSQPPRLYGLAKIHKPDVPVHPVLSMPGSPYYKVSVQVAEWLSVVEECHINSSTKFIADSLHDIKLRMMRNLLASMLRLCILTYRCMKPLKSTYKLTILWEIQKTTVDEETFKELLKVCSCDVTMLKNDGYYKQIDGLAMGSPTSSSSCKWLDV